MAFNFSIIDFAGMDNPEIIQNSVSDVTSTVGSYIGKEFSFNTAASVTGQTGAGRYPNDGGQLLTESLSINGRTYPANSLIEADWEFISVDPDTGLYYRVTGLYVNNQPVGVSVSRAWDAQKGQYVDGPAGVYQPGTTLRHIDGDILDRTPNISRFATGSSYTDYGAATGMSNDATLNDSNGATVCFAQGCMIATQGGETAVEDLRLGDLILTQDHGAQPVRWIGKRYVSARELALCSHLCAIRISAGALGAGLPKRDVLLSPQHRILVRSKIAGQMFDTPEVLVAAKQLLQTPGIEIADDLTELVYFHILLDQHEVIFTSGAPAESLYMGPQALKSISPAALAEIETLFPEIADPAFMPKAARPLINGRRARNLGQRHMQKSLPFVAEGV